MGGEVQGRDELARAVQERADRAVDVVKVMASGGMTTPGTDVMRTQFTTEDLAFLGRPLHGFLTVAAGPQPPQPRPVWFEATADGTIQFFTAPDSLKIRRLRRDPRASIVVAAPVGERERWVSVAGRTTVEPDGAHDLVTSVSR